MRPSVKVAGANDMAIVIIQENDSAVLDVLTLAFAMENHTTIPILGGSTEEISNSIRSHRPDLILIEYRSNTSYGALLLAAIRKISSTLPVIALSCDLNVGRIAAKIGFNEFLSKPFDLGELYDKVGSFLSGNRGHRLDLAD